MIRGPERKAIQARAISIAKTAKLKFRLMKRGGLSFIELQCKLKIILTSLSNSTKPHPIFLSR